MQIKELEASLPFGFHDADLNTVQLDYAGKVAVLRMALWVDTRPAEDGGHIPIRRGAELTLRGLDYFVIEAPTVPVEKKGCALDVSGDSPPPDRVLPRVSDASFVYAFYVSDWNSYILVAANDAELTWLEPET